MMSHDMSAGGGSSLVVHQLVALMRLEVRKTFLSRRALPVYLLACLPLMLGAIGIAGNLIMGAREMNVGASQTIFAHFYLNGVLMVVVFFGSAGIFMNLFRGDVIDRSLHYYFLSPIRREVLVAGKLLAGLIGSALLFGAVTFLGYLLLLISADPYHAGQVLATEGVFGQGFGYVYVTVLACLGYGAIFLLLGLFLRNPLISAVVLWGWESINFLLPPVLQQVSVIHYLKGLTPMPVSEGPFAFVGESPSPVFSGLCLLLLVAVAVTLASVRVRRMEIRYDSD